MKGPDEDYIERGIAQAEYANLLATIDWKVVHGIIDVWLDRMCEALYVELGLREPSDQVILKRYLSVRAWRVQRRRGKL